MINRRNANLLKKGLIERPLAPLVVEIAYNPKTLSGVINRRNGCGPTVALKRANL
ncbi:hypothetical protein [Methanosarcina sp.]|uniref:hypothetical protein n=1 Tax=Methanosarcina sp. TaxID=2213 RepID=UPI003C744CD2